MRVAVLWQALTGYFNACLKSLAGAVDDIFVCYEMPRKVAPHSAEMSAWLLNALPYQEEPESEALLERLTTFKPDLVLISSWHISAFLRIAVHYRGKIPRVLCMDNPWLGTGKQIGGIIGRRLLIRPYFDFAFVPGERCARFARYLGFEQSKIFYGLYATDHKLYGAGSLAQSHRRTFIQVSRLVEAKGIRYLAEGYKYYRDRSNDPWGLVVCGTGPETARLEHQPGITCRGFLTEADTAKELSIAGCFVMASIFDPWPGAIQEAACAGLPIICTTACGASEHLVQDGFNGFLVASHNAMDIGEAMLRIARLTDARREEFGKSSQLLSRQFSPERWTETVLRAGRQFADGRRNRSQSP